MSPSVIAISFTFALAFAVFGLASSAPDLQQQQHRAEEGSSSTGGLGMVLWSVLDDCFGDESDGSAAICLKSKALTALDRALSKPTVVVAEGVSLSARAGKSLLVDPQTEKADRAALDAVKDSDRKSAMLNDMLIDRMDRLMSSRTIVLDGSVDQEGRGKKKDKGMKQAMMMAGMTAAAVMGPMALKMLMMMAGKALLLSKIALVLSGIIAIKKLLMSQKGEQEQESHPPQHWGRSMQFDAHDIAYSGQK
uniref:Uncharacterized protein n=1 Tax=Sipha flava TaxID=143950 RepID=A0A2S2QRN0_9HEMI